jgi:hypothetical protein
MGLFELTINPLPVFFEIYPVFLLEGIVADVVIFAMCRGAQWDRPACGWPRPNSRAGAAADVMRFAGPFINVAERFRIYRGAVIVMNNPALTDQARHFPHEFQPIRVLRCLLGLWDCDHKIPTFRKLSFLRSSLRSH